MQIPDCQVWGNSKIAQNPLFFQAITAELAAKAKELALEHKLHAQEDPQYANTQYPLDMQRNALYAEAVRHLI